jgi:DNA recombination protein RmuC
MGEIGIYVLLIVLAGGLGYLLAYVSAKSKISSQVERLRLLEENELKLNDRLAFSESEKETLRREREEFQNLLTKKSSDLEHLMRRNEEQKQEVKELQAHFQKEFENLANKILEEKTEKFTQKNKENIDLILKPLQEKIKNFEEKVEQNSKDFIERHAQLGQHLRILHEQSQKISEDAINLTKALKGESKTQGNWGELILERVLERSGLTKDREYFVQQTNQDSDGNKLIPDVVIHLPNDKKMVIDSKVSLTAYERYVNEEDETVKLQHLKEHIRSLHNHIKQLSQKKYEDLYKMTSPDFVLMFIPIEPALYLAQNNDSSFFYTAFQQNILLVSPTTLLSTLRTIDAIWSNEKQHQNALEIAQHASSLYHKFKILLDDLETVGNRLKSTSTAYQDAMRKLTGNQNLIKDIHKLEQLGIAPKQKISQKWIERAQTEGEQLSLEEGDS